MIRPFSLAFTRSANSREYIAQTVLALMQVGAVIIGIVLSAITLKIAGYPNGEPLHREWPSLTVFIRNWGFVYLFIPVFWAIVTMNLENNTGEWSKRWTIVSGVIVFIGLIVFFISNGFKPLMRPGIQAVQ